MKKGKVVTSGKLTIDYIISFLVWGLLGSLLLEPVLEVICENILDSVFNDVLAPSMTIYNVSNYSIAYVICVIILSMLIGIIINLLTNVIATYSSIGRLDSIDKTKADEFLKNVTVFLIICQIILLIGYGLILRQFTLVNWISNIIAFLISLFFIRKHIKKCLKSKSRIDKPTKCSKCGYDLDSSCKFCENCGANVIYENSFIDDNLVNAYIGKNAENLKNGGISFCPLIPGYVFYRKMWALGIIWFICYVIIGNFLSSNHFVVLIIDLVMTIIICIMFKSLYLRKVKERIENIVNKNKGMSQQQLTEICKNKGGTSLFAPILFIIVCVLLMALIVVPQVLKILNEGKQAYAEDVSYTILKQADAYVVNFKEQYGSLPPKELEFECNGDRCKLITTMTGYNMKNLEYFEVKDASIKSGKVKIGLYGKNVSIKNIEVNGYICNLNNYNYVECINSNDASDMDIVEDEDNDYKIGNLSFNLSSKFSKDLSDEDNRLYSLSDNKSSCSVSIHTYTSSLDQTDKQFIERYYSLDTTINLIIESKYNGVVWSNVTITGENNYSQNYYVTKYNNVYYAIKFSTMWDESSVCANELKSFVNSLKFD